MPISNKKAKKIYGFKDEQYIDCKISSEWSDIVGICKSSIADHARRRKPYKNWFFSYENTYEPKKVYETF
jgi:hypothetical protein